MAVFDLSFTMYTSGTDRHTVVPMYKNVSIDETKDASGMFFRRSISGEFTFVGKDYEWIRKRADITSKIYIDIIDRRDNYLLLTTFFRQVDATSIDVTRKQIVTKLSVIDSYDKVLANMNTEYDLVELSPKTERVIYKIADTAQIVGLGGSSIANLYRLSCVNKEINLIDLQEMNRYGFGSAINACTAWISTQNLATPEEPEQIVARVSRIDSFEWPTHDSGGYDDRIQIKYPPQTSRPEKVWDVYMKTLRIGTFSVKGNNYYLDLRLNLVEAGSFGSITFSQTTYSVLMVNVQDPRTPILLAGDPLKNPWNGEMYDALGLATGIPPEQRWSASVGNTAIILGTFYFNRYGGRVLSNTFTGLYGDAEKIEDKDPYTYSRIYKFKRSLNIISALRFSNTFTTEKTKYGEAYREMVNGEEVIYYIKPPEGDDIYEPVDRNGWFNGWSLWVNKGQMKLIVKDSATENPPLTNVVNSNFIEIGEAIRVILNKIDPSVKFDSTALSSEFLYDVNNDEFKKEGVKMKILITQKSNVNKPNSDFYATKMPVTLGNLLNMLKETYNIYWHMEGDRLRLEQVRWYFNGGSYAKGGRQPVDLGLYKDRFNNKAFNYFTGEFVYDLTGEYTKRTFSWGEDASPSFSKMESTMRGTYDDTNRSYDVSLSGFYADIEYCGIFGGDLTNDGLAVVTCLSVGVDRNYVASMNNASLDMINSELATRRLLLIYLKDNLPAGSTYIGPLISNVTYRSLSRKGKVTIPASLLKDWVYSIVRTEAGDGYIEKISLDLNSDYATLELMYNFEK